MLPFMKPKRVAGLIVSQRKPDGSKEEMGSEGDGEMHPLHPAAEDILRAISSKDPHHLAMAIQAALDIHGARDESMDDADGLSPDDHSYAAQNIRAAKSAKE